MENNKRDKKKKPMPPQKPSENEGDNKPNKKSKTVTIAKKKLNTDIDMMRDSLGYLFAAATDAKETYDIIRSVDKIISYEKAMLKYLQRYPRYETKFNRMREQLKKALDICNITTGDWKDSNHICSNIFDDLLDIAVDESLVMISNTMFNPTLFRSTEDRNYGGMRQASDMEE